MLVSNLKSRHSKHEVFCADIVGVSAEKPRFSGNDPTKIESIFMLEILAIRHLDTKAIEIDRFLSIGSNPRGNLHE